MGACRGYREFQAIAKCKGGGIERIWLHLMDASKFAGRQQYCAVTTTDEAMWVEVIGDGMSTLSGHSALSPADGWCSYSLVVMLSTRSTSPTRFDEQVSASFTDKEAGKSSRRNKRRKAVTPGNGSLALSEYCCSVLHPETNSSNKRMNNDESNNICRMET